MPEKLPCVIYMRKDDPATIPARRHRNALRHTGWSQLSLAISDIGLRGLTLLCKGLLCNELQTLPRASPQTWPGSVPEITPLLRQPQPRHPAATGTHAVGRWLN